MGLYSTPIDGSSIEAVYLEWELVERIDLVEIIENEVEQWGPGSSWAVVLSSFIDLLLGCLGLSNLYMYILHTHTHAQ